MALSFWVKNNAVIDTEIADLGFVLSGSQELDLYTACDISDVNQSASLGDLSILEAANTIDYLSGPGGSAIAADDAPIFNVSQTQIDTISASGITETQHKNLDQLVHDIAENGYTEYTYSGNKVSSEIIWTTPDKTLKIREFSFVYTGNKVLTETVIQYNGAGAAVQTLTRTFSYTGNKIASTTEVVV